MSLTIKEVRALRRMIFEAYPVEFKGSYIAVSKDRVALEISLYALKNAPDTSGQWIRYVVMGIEGPMTELSALSVENAEQRWLEAHPSYHASDITEIVPFTDWEELS